MQAPHPREQVVFSNGLGCGRWKNVRFTNSVFFTSRQDLKPQAFRNAYDIPRSNLLDQLTRMRTNLLKTHKLILGQDEGKLCSVWLALKCWKCASGFVISMENPGIGNDFVNLRGTQRCVLSVC